MNCKVEVYDLPVALISIEESYIDKVNKFFSKLSQIKNIIFYRFKDFFNG